MEDIALPHNSSEFLVSKADYEAVESFLLKNFGSYEIDEKYKDSLEDADNRVFISTQGEGRVSFDVDEDRRIIRVAVICELSIDISDLIKLSHLKELNFVCNVKNLDLLLKADLAHLTKLRVQEVDQHQLDIITNFTGLEALDVEVSTAVDFKNLANLKNLKELCLSSSNSILFECKAIFDSVDAVSSSERYEKAKKIGKMKCDNINVIFSLSNLEYLYLGGDLDCDFPSIVKLQNLKQFDIGGIKDQKQFEIACKLQNLRSISIDSRDLLPYICNLTKLEELSACCCDLNSSDLDIISKIKTLKILNISGNPELDLSNIDALENLEELNVDCCNITQAVFNSIFSLKKLSNVFFCGTTELNWSRITQADSLVDLGVVNCIISQNDLDAIFSSHVIKLDLCDIGKLNYDKIVDSNIRELHIDGAKLDQESLEAICNCRSITSLELFFISDKLDYSCITKLPNLKKLCIANCNMDEKDIKLLKSLKIQNHISQVDG